MTDIATWTNDKGQYRARTEKSFRWQHDTSPQELEAYYGLLLAMGLVREANVTGYWANDELFGQNYFKNRMSGRRFFAISRSLRVCMHAWMNTIIYQV